MISGFLTSVISSPTTPAYRGTPYVDYWFLPSSTPAFLAAKRLISEPIESVPMKPECCRLLYKRDCYLVRRSREGHEWTSDNGAHRCVDYCFCKRTAIISAAKVRHCKRKDCPDALFLLREWRPTGHVFLASSCLTPTRGFALFN